MFNYYISTENNNKIYKIYEKANHMYEWNNSEKKFMATSWNFYYFLEHKRILKINELECLSLIEKQQIK